MNKSPNEILFEWPPNKLFGFYSLNTFFGSTKESNRGQLWNIFMVDFFAPLFSLSFTFFSVMFLLIFLAKRKFKVCLSFFLCFDFGRNKYSTCAYKWNSVNSLGSEISCSCTVLERLNMVWFGLVSQTHHFNQSISVMSNSHANDIVEWCVYYCKWKVHPFCFGFGNCNRMRCVCYILLLYTRAQVWMKFLVFFPSFFLGARVGGIFVCRTLSPLCQYIELIFAPIQIMISRTTSDYIEVMIVLCIFPNVGFIRLLFCFVYHFVRLVFFVFLKKRKNPYFFSFIKWTYGMNSTRIPLQRSVPFRSIFLFVYVAVVLVE